MEFYTLSDMAKRWNVSKQYVNKLKNEDSNFPEADMKKGRYYLYKLETVESYERTKDFDNPHTNRIERIQREEAKDGKE
jgi:hypothetical protein